MSSEGEELAASRNAFSLEMLHSSNLICPIAILCLTLYLVEVKYEMEFSLVRNKVFWRAPAAAAGYIYFQELRSQGPWYSEFNFTWSSAYLGVDQSSCVRTATIVMQYWITKTSTITVVGHWTQFEDSDWTSLTSILNRRYHARRHALSRITSHINTHKPTLEPKYLLYSV